MLSPVLHGTLNCFRAEPVFYTESVALIRSQFLRDRLGFLTRDTTSFLQVHPLGLKSSFSNTESVALLAT